MSMILIPIKPKYVSMILDRTKKYEYRRIKPKRLNISSMIVYSTSPVKKVVCEVEIEGILEDTVDNIWNSTKDYAGIDKKSFYKYFENRNKAYAFKLGRVIKYKEAKDLEDLGINYVPQSFVYLEDSVN